MLAGLLALPSLGYAAPKAMFSSADFRGGLDAAQFGVRPGDIDKGAKAFNRMLREAASRNLPVFLPPGHYQLSNIELPDNIQISGVRGATRLVHKCSQELECWPVYETSE